MKTRIVYYIFGVIISLLVLTSIAGPSYDVADPYGGPREGYVMMAAELQRLIEAAGPRIVALAGVPAGSQPPAAAE